MTRTQIAERHNVGIKSVQLSQQLKNHDKKTGSDLAGKAHRGEITGTEALRQIKKSQIHETAPIEGKYRIWYADPEF